MTRIGGGSLRTGASALAAVVLGAFPAAIGVAQAGATTRGQACSVSTRSTTVGQYLGVLRPAPIGGAAAAQCPASGSTHASGASGAVNPSGLYSGTPPLLYHGGPVMSTPAVGNQLTLTPIFWAPSGYNFASTYKSVVDQFVTDVATGSGSATNVFSVLRQYTDSSGNHVAYHLVAGTPVADTHSFPASGCTADAGAVYSDNSGYSKCLTDAQLRTEIQNELTTQSLPTGLGHMYLLFLPKGVENCLSSADGASGGSCTLNSHASSAGGFCAYHSGFGAGPAIYASEPFPIYSSPLGYTCGPDGAGLGIQSPNGNADADVVVSSLSHEVSEAMTDPNGTAWYDSSGNEIGDDCAYIFGGLSGTSGTKYNQSINGHHYLVQEEFSNEDYVASTSGCVQREELPTASFSMAAPAYAGQSVSFDGSASADADPRSGGVVSYSWSFGDGSTLVTTSPLTSHVYTTTGTVYPALQVTDKDGWTSAVLTKDLSVGAPPLSVSGISPSSISPGASLVPVTVTGQYFSTDATLSDGNPAVTFSSVTVQSPTSITADASVTAGATTTGTDVSVTDLGSYSATCTGCLTVGLGPVVATVSPSRVVTGTSPTVQLSGTNFQSGAVVSVSGTGVSASVDSVSASSISAGLTVGSGAPAGTRDVTVTNPDAGATTCHGCLTIDAAPTITGISPSSMLAGTSRRARVSGTAFVSGEVVSISGSGVGATVTATSATSITVTVTAASTALAGGRTVTVTNPDGGSVTCTTCLSVSRPVVKSVTPSGVGQRAKSYPVTISGSGFNSRATLADSEKGVTFSSVVFVTSTKVTAKVTVLATASVAATTVRIIDSGGATGSCSKCLTVDAAPKVSSVSPTTLKTGTTRTVKIFGGAFKAGAKVAISGGGLTITVISLSATEIKITVKVRSTATTGHRKLTITNRDGGSVAKTGIFYVSH